MVRFAAAALLAACAPSDPASPDFGSAAPSAPAPRRPNVVINTTLWSQTFVRDKGKPVVQVATIGALDARSTREIALTIQNGLPSGDDRVSSGRVSVNGVEVAGSALFSNAFAGTTLLVPIGTVRPVHVEVELASAPGSQVTLSIAAGAPVSEAGGTLPLAGGTVTVVAPPGAVAGPIAISAEPLPPTPTGAEFGAFEFGPDGAQFAQPLTVTLPYPTETFPTGSEPALYSRDSDTDPWVELESVSFDAAAGTVSGRIDHFTQIGVRVRNALVCPGIVGVIPTLDSALKVVAERGTVRLCETAEHAANSVRVTKPVTIVSAGLGRARVLAGPTSGLIVDGVRSGAVTVRRLSVTGTAATHVLAQGTYDDVVVDSSDFTLRDGATSAVYAFPSTVNGARMTVRGIRAVGGNTGVVANGANRVDVVDSRFEGQKGAGNLRYFPFNFTVGGAKPNGSIINNVFDECARLACISIDGADQVTIADNTLRSTLRAAEFSANGSPAGFGALSLPGVRFGISVTARRAFIMNNTLTGIGNIGEQGVAGGGHPFAYGGIAVQGTTNAADFSPVQAELIGNEIDGGYIGVRVYRQPTGTASPASDVTVNARENRVTRAGLAASFSGGPAVAFQRNDFALPLGLAPVQQDNVNAAVGRGPVLPGSLACNWFGDARGPQVVSTGNAPFGLDAYLPVAAEPIAGAPEVSCVPGSQPLPLNVRFCATGTLWDAVPTVRILGSAVASTRTGGTLDICAGTYAATLTTLTRAMTLRGEGVHDAVFDAASAAPNIVFFVKDAGPGTITLRNVAFRNTRNAAVQVEGIYDRVVVEQSAFLPGTNTTVTSGNGFFSGVTVGNAVGNGVSIRGNSFTGGDVGVNSYGTQNIDVDGNTFADHANAAVHVGGGPDADALVRNNTVTGCGPFRCFLANNPRSATFRNNTIAIPFRAPRTTHGIEGNGGSLTIVENRIIGTGGAQVANDQSAWPALIGIKINPGQTGQIARVDSNTVTAVYAGMRFDASTVTGTDNIVDNVSEAIDARNGTTTMRRNDFTNYKGTAFLPGPFVPAPGAFTCNHWGNSAGPALNQNGAVVRLGAFLPSSSQPIARQAGVACNPAPAPLLMSARVCPLNGNVYDTAPTFRNLAWALGNVAPGATVQLCDADHPVANQLITFPVTVQSESATRARLVSGTGQNMLLIGEFIDGTVRLQSLDIRSAGPTGIFIQGGYRTVEIHDVKITLPAGISNHGIYAGAASVPGARISVSNSEFSGGLTNIFSPVGGQIDITSSRFSNTGGFGNIQFQASGPNLAVGGTISDSEFDECGGQGCIRSPGGATSLTIVRNRFRSTGRRNAAGASVVQGAIQVSAAALRIEDNVIEGLGGVVGSPATLTSYPFNTAAILITAQPTFASTALVRNNVISGAARALQLDRGNPAALGLTVQGSGNIATDLHTAVLARGGPLLMLTRNDFVNAAVAGIREDVAIAGRPGIGANGSSLVCNWWGSASGPNGIAASAVPIPAAVYTPFAAAPIAVSQTGCTP